MSDLVGNTEDRFSRVAAQLYDSEDVKSVHLSTKGASVLVEKQIKVFRRCSFAFGFDTLLSRKRNRSVMTNTPPRFPNENVNISLAFRQGSYYIIKC